MDRGAWRAVVHRVPELDTTEATAHTGGYYQLLCELSFLPRGQQLGP